MSPVIGYLKEIDSHDFLKDQCLPFLNLSLFNLYIHRMIIKTFITSLFQKKRNYSTVGTDRT